MHQHIAQSDHGQIYPLRQQRQPIKAGLIAAVIAVTIYVRIDDWKRSQR